MFRTISETEGEVEPVKQIITDCSKAVSCCGSLLFVFLSVSETIHHMYVLIVLVRSRLLSGHLL